MNQVSIYVFHYILFYSSLPPCFNFFIERIVSTYLNDFQSAIIVGSISIAILISFLGIVYGLLNHNYIKHLMLLSFDFYGRATVVR